MEAQKLTYLLHRVSGVMTKFEGQIVNEIFNMTYSQFRILRAVGIGGLCQKQIAEYWGITEAAVSRQVEILVTEGLLKRSEDKENRRKNSVEVTEKGRKKLEAAQSYLLSKYEELLSNISDQSKSSTEEVLQILIDKLSR